MGRVAEVNDFGDRDRVADILELGLAYGRMIKFSHTLFALPFSLSAIILSVFQHMLFLWSILFFLLAISLSLSPPLLFHFFVDSCISFSSSSSLFSFFFS